MSRGASEVRLNDQIRTLFQSGSLGALSDGQLLDRYASREGESSEMAFAALVERHGPMVLGICRRLLCDAHLAEDAFQATFLVLARRAKSIRNRDTLGGWLHRVAHRIAMRLRGRFERRKSRERPGNEEVAVKQPDQVERDELQCVIDHEIDRLGDAQRLPVVLCCLEGISHEEASQRLKWPVGTLKSRLARGRLRLQERLIRRGFAPAAVAAGSGLLGIEASAAVPPALTEATMKAAAAAAGGVLTGVIPPALSAMVREELGAMLATKIRMAVAATLAAGASTVLLGVVIAAVPSRKGEVSPLPGVVTRNGDEPKVHADAPRLAAKLSASGIVIDSSGRPIHGARVILREWSESRVQGMPPLETEKLVRGEALNDTLLEIKTDEAGRFRFQDVPAPAFPHLAEAGKTVFPWDIVALAPGHGLAWAQLTRRNQRIPITLRLGPEGILHGQVVQPGGNPVVGAKIKVFGVDPLGRPDETGLGNDNRLNLMWSGFPLGVTTGADGRFTIRGLPRDRIVSLYVIEQRHERVFAYAATTDVAQPDVVSGTVRAGKPDEIRTPIHTGEFALTAKVADHVLSGRVVRQSDGAAVANAVVIHNGLVSKADQNGRFRIEGLVSGKLDLHASSESSDTEAAPVAVEIEIPEQPRETERTLVLPQGLVVTGRVVDGTNRRGVNKAVVEFHPKYDANQTPTVFGFSRETDALGHFRLAVPPGRGTIVLRTFPLDFPQPERRHVGQPEDPGFSRKVEGRAGQTLEVAEFKLMRGREVVLHVLDALGQPLSGARIDVRDQNRPPNTAPGRTDAQGRYTVVGLSSEQSTVIDVIDANESLGATVEIPEAGTNGANGADLYVRLQPLLSLSGRVLDEDGKPLSDAVVRLYRDVEYSGQSGRSFGIMVETQNEIDDQGSYTFNRLIAGATYNTSVEDSGHPNATSEHVMLRPDRAARLKDFRLPTVDQEVRGVVVDPRGKPLAAISVSAERNARTGAFYAPSGAVWFQDTDLAGRFHLTSLPRGPIRLMLYRKPPESDRQIRGIKYFEVPPGQSDLRIELPDENDRLRGVE